jgi:uroporphyrin-3 C-methyltransferase/uroporphyrinogen III methyltransferase/synthase
LQYAESRLSRSDKPQFIVIRRAVAKDMERLKALPTVDLTGIALRLDSAIGQIENMPLLSDEKPIEVATPPKTSRRARKSAAAETAAPPAKTSAGSEWLANLENKWNSWSNEMWGELKQLIRVRNVDTPDALLMSPTQALLRQIQGSNLSIEMPTLADSLNAVRNYKAKP